MQPAPRIPRLLVVALLAGGAIAGGAAVQYWRTGGSGGAPPVKADAPAVSQADVERLKTLVPSQSHGMFDVGFHWTNLWFAAREKNWPLAEFYFNESRQHIQWTIRIRPIRKDLDGKDVDLKAIFDAVDTSSFAAVKLAITQHDQAGFVTAYKLGLDGCNSCHKASAKPFLRVVVPSAPAQAIIDFMPDPAAGPS